MFDKRRFIVSFIFIMMAIATLSHQAQTLYRNRSRRFLQADDDDIDIEGTTPTHEHSSENYPPSHPKFWLCLFFAALLVMMAAICSGMTVGYLSIDKLSLEIKQQQGTQEEYKVIKNILSQNKAAIILPILQQHHMLLCTLLVANALCMESLPIFFDKVVPPAFAILISVFFIVFAGEILPQAICTGPNQLKIAAKLTPVIKVIPILLMIKPFQKQTIMIVLWPITFPLSKALDYYFGEHGAIRFEKNELKALIELHEIQKQHDSQHAIAVKKIKINLIIINKSGFTQPEINMITSTIDLRDKNVIQAMIPLNQIVSFNANVHLTKELLEQICSSGYSYIAIYESEKHNIVGTIKTKFLVDSYHDKFMGKRMGQLTIVSQPLIITSDTNLLELLMIFKNRKTKLAFIEEKAKEKDSKDASYRSISNQIVEGRRIHKIVGLISLKDIFEELVKKELHDQDNHVPYFSLVILLIYTNNQLQSQQKLKEASEQQEK